MSTVSVPVELPTVDPWADLIVEPTSPPLAVCPPPISRLRPHIARRPRPNHERLPMFRALLIRIGLRPDPLDKVDTVTLRNDLALVRSRAERAAADGDLRGSREWHAEAAPIARALKRRGVSA